MEKMTPMITQYHRIKGENPGAMLLFRVGDFYETFFEDAATASRVLGIALTSRNHGKGKSVPLAGIPHHALERYVVRLIKAGHKVAICDQVEDPKLAKGIVRREVTEVITAGTALRPSLLDEKRENLLAAANCDGGRCGLAFCDLSTGALRVTEIPLAELSDELARNGPSELLVPIEQRKALDPRLGGATVTGRDDGQFDGRRAGRVLTEHFQVASLDGFGCQDMPLALGAAGAVIEYLRENQKSVVPHIARVAPYRLGGQMLLDRATIRNLGLLPETGQDQPTLLSVLDRTRTAMGARLLRRWLAAPLLDTGQIELRLDALQDLKDNPERHDGLAGKLGSVQDIERLLSRIVCQRAGPRDLVGLASSLKIIPSFKALLPQAGLWAGLWEGLRDFGPLADLIDKAIEPDPPPGWSQGGFIRPGYSPDLDELRELARGDKTWVAGLQQKERERTGISSLKVGFNSVFGYYIEISKPNLGSAPADYLRRQTLANAERFITPELKEREDRILGAEEKVRQMEAFLFAGVRDRVAEWGPRIKQAAEAVAAVDAVQSLARASASGRYVRPVVDRADRINIVDGRHPVVETQFQLGRFVPNDARLDAENRTSILTGPNMAGKSTYLRQVALAAIMAQMGCFVPAREAHIGLVDRVFTRIGASDDLAKGVSTFMAEMQETANILNNATDRSLVLLDEIGRGTSTFDGLAIAWAVTEHLHDLVKCRTLFATHYHELTELAAQRPGVQNLRMAVREWGEEILFLRKVERGCAGQSYGVKVARLAGLPGGVVARAGEILRNLEADAFLADATPRLARRREEEGQEAAPSLFTPGQKAALEEIVALEPETMTPLEALNRIAKLKTLAGEANQDG
ncbi:MAG TPA: DNA mismatch repair protein MutS [candidate division Zixibacteria bacterium]|nr:DNA mismatch repair protein MutS [candidate division Zixibacteria bacterium]